MSQKASPKNSRNVSPVPENNTRSYNIVKVVHRKPTKPRKKLIFIIFLVIILLCAANYEPTNYCTHGYDILCRKCPRHAGCEKNHFKCKGGYKPVDRGCFNITDGANISEIRDEIRKFIYRNNTWNYELVLDNFSKYNKNDVKAAIFGDGKMENFGDEIVPVFRISNEFLYFVLGMVLTSFFSLFVVSQNIVY